MRWLGLAAGIALIGVTWTGVIKTFMIPREVRVRLNRVVAVSVNCVFRLATARVHNLVRRERLLAMSPAVFLFCLLASWLICLWFGFALLLWTTKVSFSRALRESGSSLLRHC